MLRHDAAVAAGEMQEYCKRDKHHRYQRSCLKRAKTRVPHISTSQCEPFGQETPNFRCRFPVMHRDDLPHQCARKEPAWRLVKNGIISTAEPPKTQRNWAGWNMQHCGRHSGSDMDGICSYLATGQHADKHMKTFCSGYTMRAADLWSRHSMSRHSMHWAEEALHVAEVELYKLRNLRHCRFASVCHSCSLQCCWLFWHGWPCQSWCRQQDSA